MQQNRISKAFFLGTIAVGLGIAAVLIVLGTINNDIELISLSWIPMLPTMIVMVILFYKMWSAIQDGHARTSAGKAIGFLFIPFFNVYWTFQAIWGFSKDYNKFVTRYSLDTVALPEGLFLAYAILVWTTWIPVIGLLFLIVNYFIGIIMVSKICDGVNNLPLLSELEQKA